MANGGLDPDDFVIRSVPRSGHKREFAFAVTSQPLVESVGRTRSGKERLLPSPNKRLHRVVAEEDGAEADQGAGECSEEERPAALKVVGGDGENVNGDESDAVHGGEGGGKADQPMGKIVASLEKVLALPAMGAPATVGVSSSGNTQKVTVSVVDNGVSLKDDDLIRPAIVSVKTKRFKKSLATPDAARRFTRSMLKEKSDALDETPGPVAVGELAVEGRINEEQSGQPNGRRANFLADVDNRGSPPKVSVKDAEMVEALNEVNKELTEKNPALRVADENVVSQAPSSVEMAPTRTKMSRQSFRVVDEKLERLGNNNGFMEVDNVLVETPGHSVLASSRSTDVRGKIECINDQVMETHLNVSGRRFTRSLLKERNTQVSEESGSESADATIEERAVENKGSRKSKKFFDAAADANISQLSKESQIKWSALMKNLELKMSKKIALSKCPTSAEELLSTGLLEGLRVRYPKGSLCGKIRDFGILCPCNFCKDIKVITTCQFLKHAGGTKKDPWNNIVLDNGKSIGDVLRACDGVPVHMLVTAIRNAIPSPAMEQIKSDNSDELIISSPSRGKKSGTSIKHEGKLYNRYPASDNGCKTSSSPKPMVTAKSLNSASKKSSLKNNSAGRVTKKDLGLHKLVFSEDALPDGTEVAYYNAGKKLLEGYKQGNGIYCRCCNTEVSPSQFEAHAGCATRRKPYLNIYTSNGVSLHELSLSLSKGRKHSNNDNDDLCSICCDGGDLLLCDLCPRAFHQDCIGLTCLPRGKWYCNYCEDMMEKEKFVENNVNAIAAGRVSGIDSIEQITKRCIRIVDVKPPVADASYCFLCRQHDFSKKFGPRTVILCDQCEREYHVGCLKDYNMGNLEELPSGNWFCCGECNSIYDSMQKIILDGPEKVSRSLCGFIKSNGDNGSVINGDCDVSWRLSGKNATFSDNRVILSRAVAIFHERFDPIVDSMTGRDMIPAMVYGRTVGGQDFGGMYCVVLTVNSHVVSAGILRVFGQGAAELPLVATSREFQGQGYFQTLFLCIERLLVSLNVKHLMLPAANEAQSIWTNKFGFKKVDGDEDFLYANDSHVTTFHGTSLLYKLVPKKQVKRS